MINLVQYREYWERVASVVPEITGVLPVTVDRNMGEKIKSLPKDSLTLFVLPPMAEGGGRPDSFKEKNICVVFVMAKYDPQRVPSFRVLEETQPVMEVVKRILLETPLHGCSLMRPDPASIVTSPETELYGNFAGWSMEFTTVST